MKSRRRIAFSKAHECADYRLQGCDYSKDLRPAKWGPTVILRGNNPWDCAMTYDKTPKNWADLKPPGYWSKAAGRFIPVHEMTEEWLHSR
jgi:hypothetical protein